MPFELPYSALTTYSPRGQTELSRRSRVLRDHVKGVNTNTLDQLAAMLRDGTHNAGILSEFISPSTVLVPVPRSTLPVKNGLWPSLTIAESLKNAGVVSQVAAYLRRQTPIPKSAFQARGERPSLDIHIESLAVDMADVSLLPIELTLVDDFVTKGTTLYACASKLRGSFPNATIRAFALVRTMGLVSDIQSMIDPCIGTITYNGYDISRSHSHY